jgi:4-phospho-D-threonate 3-dehydrogenase / 4-phospho-D-erythronate 3-dehydrogenase
MTRLPRLAITMGDPAGVGPEVVVKALADPAVRAGCEPVVVGDGAHLHRVAQRCGMRFDAEMIQTESLPPDLPIGEVSPVAGEAAWRAIDAGVRVCLDGSADVLVTAPINKVALNAAGRGHQGHTELLQEMSGAEWSQTLFMLDRLRILFYSRHVSLRQAIDSIRSDRIVLHLERFASAAPALGMQSPRIAVAGINPHCGEGGLFGTEEIEEIEPAVREARARGLDVIGPLPGDSVFHLAREHNWDVVLSFYHDQASGVPKSINFNRTVSVTLGLPFLRFSVDHGTAFDIASEYRADATNMINTILLASKHAGGRAPHLDS